MKTLKTAKELYDYVTQEYRKYDTELNGLFFDVPVQMPQYEILRAYQQLQEDINGDDVVLLKDETEFVLHGGETGIFGTVIPIVAGSGFDEIYTGNCKEFLESFNDQEEESHLYRLDDTVKNGNNIGGEKLLFVF